MRVIQIINHAGLNRGGAERIARGLHEGLLAIGQKATLIAIEACNLVGVECATSLGFSSPYAPGAMLELGRQLRTLVGAGDVLHAHLFPSTLYVSALRQGRILRSPCAMTEHSTWNRRRQHPVGRTIDRVVYRGFDRVVAVSNAARTELLRNYPGTKADCIAIANGVRLTFSTPPCRDPHPQCPVLLSIGRLVPAKNLGNVISALARLKDRQWRYDVVGDGPERDTLQALASRLGVADRVHFMGQQQCVAPYLARSDLFLMPSRHEGFGIAAVEAMNAGLPIVASDIPGLREVVGPTGAPLVLPSDICAIATAINGLLDDPDRRATLGRIGHFTAQKYNLKGMVASYLDAWSDLSSKCCAP